MKVKANGINFNCQLDGHEGAPWLVFSNSLASPSGTKAMHPRCCG